MDIIKTLSVSHSVQTAAGELAILHDINLTIAAGESAAIVGASGSGKSTLLGMLAGLDTPSAGQVWLAGQDLTQLDEEARAALRMAQVAFVFQNFQLLPSLTALENVMLPLELKGIQAARAEAEQYLDRVGLSARARHYPQQLSGGEQQRVALARAFACRAPLLFADEPTGNLDNATGRQIADLLFELNSAAGTTLVIVTHAPELAARCQRQFRLEAGRLQPEQVVA